MKARLGARRGPLEDTPCSHSVPRMLGLKQARAGCRGKRFRFGGQTYPCWHPSHVTISAPMLGALSVTPVQLAHMTHSSPNMHGVPGSRLPAACNRALCSALGEEGLHLPDRYTGLTRAVMIPQPSGNLTTTCSQFIRLESRQQPSRGRFQPGSLAIPSQSITAINNYQIKFQMAKSESQMSTFVVYVYPEYCLEHK